MQETVVDSVMEDGATASSPLRRKVLSIFTSFLQGEFQEVSGAQKLWTKRKLQIL